MSKRYRGPSGAQQARKDTTLDDWSLTPPPTSDRWGVAVQDSTRKLHQIEGPPPMVLPVPCLPFHQDRTQESSCPSRRETHSSSTKTGQRNPATLLQERHPGDSVSFSPSGSNYPSPRDQSTSLQDKPKEGSTPPSLQFQAMTSAPGPSNP